MVFKFEVTKYLGASFYENNDIGKETVNDL